MQQADELLQYRYQAAKKDHEQAPLVLMVHGYGSHENDLFSMVPSLPKQAHYLSVRAPRSLGFGGFAWYDIDFQAVGDKINNLEQAQEALNLLREFVRVFRAERGLEERPLWLLGFSQGTILSYAYTLNYPDEVAKLMGLSGYILKGIVPERYAPEQLQHLECFISHGTQDQVLPIEAARQSVALLEQLHIAHVYHEYPVGHGVAPDNLRALDAWMQERIAKAESHKT